MVEFGKVRGGDVDRKVRLIPAAAVADNDWADAAGRVYIVE